MARILLIFITTPLFFLSVKADAQDKDSAAEANGRYPDWDEVEPEEVSKPLRLVQPFIPDQFARRE